MTLREKIRLYSYLFDAFHFVAHSIGKDLVKVIKKHIPDIEYRLDRDQAGIDTISLYTDSDRSETDERNVKLGEMLDFLCAPDSTTRLIVDTPFDIWITEAEAKEIAKDLDLAFRGV